MRRPWVHSTTMPLPIRIGGLITDVLSGVALCLAPIAVAAFFKENRAKIRTGRSATRHDPVAKTHSW